MDRIINKLRKAGYPAYVETFTNQFGKKLDGIFLRGVRLNLEQVRILGGLPPKQGYWAIIP
jgi:hypothetical protein